jgi:hypothetical protein
MGEEMAENFAEIGDFHVTFGFFNMGPALLPLRRKTPEKSDGFGRV